MSEWKPYGCDDDYSDGLLWSGLQVSCQGDEQSQRRAANAGESGPVYGFDTEYASDYHRIDLRRVARMHKTLSKVEAGLTKLQAARGYVRSYGEYLGRVAEVLGCAGMVFERERSGHYTSPGQRYRWTTVGEGVNEANHRILPVAAGSGRARAAAAGAGERGGGVVKRPLSMDEKLERQSARWHGQRCKVALDHLVFHQTEADLWKRVDGTSGRLTRIWQERADHNAEDVGSYARQAAHHALLALAAAEKGGPDHG